MLSLFVMILEIQKGARTFRKILNGVTFLECRPPKEPFDFVR